MQESKPLARIEIVTIVFLVMIMFMSLVSSFIPIEGVSWILSAMTCLTPALASIIGLLLIMLRDRRKNTSALMASAAVVLFVMGLSWVGLSGIYFSNPDGYDLGVVVLCLLPGGFLTLSGIGIYWYATRRQVIMAEPSEFEQAGEPTQKRNATPNSKILGYQAMEARANGYRRQILALVEKKQSSSFAEQIQAVADDLGRWQARVSQLVSRLTAFEQNKMLQQDLVDVPRRIEALEVDLAAQTEPALRAEIEIALVKHRKHQDQLEVLSTLMRRTEQDLEETVTAMGTMYSQLEVLEAMEIDNARAKRLSHEVDEQVHKLNDLLGAVAEIYKNSEYEL